MTRSYLEVVNAHPEWPGDVVARGWDAIADQRYADLDEILKQLDRL